MSPAPPAVSDSKAQRNLGVNRDKLGDVLGAVVGEVDGLVLGETEGAGLGTGLGAGEGAGLGFAEGAGVGGADQTMTTRAPVLPPPPMLPKMVPQS